MQSILSDLNKTSPDIEASAIISADGLVLAAVLPQEMDEDSIGAMSAAMLSVSSRGSRELVNDVLEQILIKSTRGYILITQAGKEAVLTVITKSHNGLEHIISEIKRSIEKITALNIF
ncbi:MAG: roadblock/LC7 domain-containing protein [Methylovulum sp.]|nr:roadblock/LC7 domain-containing protein [Methylovulum sp.]